MGFDLDRMAWNDSLQNRGLSLGGRRTSSIADTKWNHVRAFLIEMVQWFQIFTEKLHRPLVTDFLFSPPHISAFSLSIAQSNTSEVLQEGRTHNHKMLATQSRKATLNNPTRNPPPR